jgi:hypothetical protein
MLGDVGQPEPVELGDRELPVHQVFLGRGVDQVLPSFAPVHALQAGLAHQPGDPLAVHRLAQAQHELGVDPRPPVSAAGFLVDSRDQLFQLLIADRPGRLRPPAPLVVTGCGNVQDPAGHRDGDSAVGEFSDQPESYFGRTLSRAK